MNPTDRDLLLYEAICHEAAEVAVEDGLPVPPASAEATARLDAAIAAKRAEIGERRLAQARAARLAQPELRIRVGLRDKSTAWLLGRVQELQAMVPAETLAIAHRDLEGASEDDLRSTVADLEVLVLGAAANDDE